jgi:hypothetical protein
MASSVSLKTFRGAENHLQPDNLSTGDKLFSFHPFIFPYLRQRKDGHFDWLYPVSRMKKQLLGPKTTVHEALQSSVQASHLFVQYRTACVGCPLARFCTLQEMTVIYAIDLPLFLDALQQFQTKP